LDKLTMLVQQNAEAIQRALTAPLTDPDTINMIFPPLEARQGNLLGFNSSTGDPEAIDPSTIGGGGLPALVDDTSPQLGGDLDTNGNDILFGDNEKAIFGDDGDLEIYHDGTNSYINSETGYLIVNDDVGGVAQIRRFFANAPGIDIGDSTVRGIRISGPSPSDPTSGSSIMFGNNNAFIFYVYETSPPSLQIMTNKTVIQAGGGVKYIECADDGTKLYHNDLARVITTTTGTNFGGSNIRLPNIPSTSRDDIPSPQKGMLIYNTTTDKLNFYNGSAWRQLDDSAV
jgi:hypothetical protein